MISSGSLVNTIALYSNATVTSAAPGTSQVRGLPQSCFRHLPKELRPLSGLAVGLASVCPLPRSSREDAKSFIEGRHGTQTHGSVNGPFEVMRSVRHCGRS